LHQGIAACFQNILKGKRKFLHFYRSIKKAVAQATALKIVDGNLFQANRLLITNSNTITSTTFINDLTDCVDTRLYISEIGF
jgi:acetylglutamate kinase